MPVLWFIVSSRIGAESPAGFTLAVYGRLRTSEPSEMRHSCFFAAMSFTLLSGCGMEDTGSSSSFNPATNVDYPLPSLTLQNQEGLEPVLPYTVFRDLYRGAEPLSAGADNGFSTELRAHLNTFLNAVPNDSGTDYKSVRNPIDLMNEVIRSGQVDNFNEGRRLMVSSIRENRAATYNTPANKALIRFSENNSDENTPPEDQAWIYTMLDWTNNPGMGKVFRAMQFVATSPDQVSASTPQRLNARNRERCLEWALRKREFWHQRV